MGVSGSRLTCAIGARGRSGPRASRALLVVGLGLLLGACGAAGGGDATTAPGATAGGTVTVNGQAVAEGPLRDAAAALCQATEQASDRRAARVIFYDRAHDRLHDLAREVQRVDRPAAARLLEAKGAVERDLDSNLAAARLAVDLARLGAATAAALQAISIAPPSCAG